MASADKMLRSHLAAMDGLASKMGYEMLMESAEGRAVLVTIRKRGGTRFEGVGSTFQVALKRAIMALQDETLYMSAKRREQVLDILEQSGVI